MRREKKKKLDASTVGVYRTVRRAWSINPRTRVVPSKKAYVRARSKQEALRSQRKEETD